MSTDVKKVFNEVYKRVTKKYKQEDLILAKCVYKFYQITSNNGERGTLCELLICKVFGLKHVGRDNTISGDAIDSKGNIYEIKTSAPENRKYSINYIKETDKNIIILLLNRELSGNYHIELYLNLNDSTIFRKNILSRYGVENGVTMYRCTDLNKKKDILQKWRVSTKMLPLLIELNNALKK